jgi:putative molybdopterin biosynthesis protein
MSRRFLTVEEVAALTRLATPTIYKLAARGEIPCCRIRRRLLFPVEQIESWIDNGGQVVRPNRVALHRQ